MQKKHSSQKKTQGQKAAVNKAAQNKTGQPRVLLYGLAQDSEKGSVLRDILAQAGVRACTVAPEQLGNPTGALAGLPGFKLSKLPYRGAVPECEFMLFAGFTSSILDAILASMREQGVSVAYKAQLTQFNKMWPFVQLIQEVSKEHEQMTRGQKA